MNNLFSDEIKNKFDRIGSELYNYKHAQELLMKQLENEINVPLEIFSLFFILKEYFDKIKNDYNNLEKELDVLL